MPLERILGIRVSESKLRPGAVLAVEAGVRSGEDLDPIKEQAFSPVYYGSDIGPSGVSCRCWPTSLERG